MERAFYPLTKRFSNFPQVVLALSFNSGILVSLSTIFESSSNLYNLPPNELVYFLPLYFAGCIWTIMYDTIYGHQDKTDDKKVGVKSMSLYWGENTKKYAQICSLLMLGLLGIHGYLFDMSTPFYFQLLFTLSLQMFYISRLNLSDPQSCNMFFQKMKVIGILLGIAFVLGNQGNDRIKKETNQK